MKKQIKKMLSVTLAVIILTIQLAVGIVAADEPSIYIEATYQESENLIDVKVYVDIAGNTNLTSLGFVVTHDATLIVKTHKEMNFGSRFDDNNPSFDPAAGTISYTAIDENGAALVGKTEIFNVRFEIPSEKKDAYTFALEDVNMSCNSGEDSFPDEESGLNINGTKTCKVTINETPIHEHIYGDWSKDDENHWHECTDAECPDKESSIKDMAEHVYANDADEECDVCGHVREIEQPHEHTYSADWSYDETYHWHAATCEHDVVADKGEHIDADSDGKCDVCGYEVEPEQPHKHTFSTAWSYDEAYHWHKSTCGHDDIVADKATHTASAWIVDMEATYRNAGRMHKECVTCGYILETAVIPASDPSQAPWWGITNRPETTRKYTLTATAGNGGSITNEGTYTILTGLDLTYTITPMRGYAIESVFVDGRDMGAITEYTFRNVKANHTISATFRKSFENPFIDIFESDRYYDAVAFVYENELFKGVSAREFAPDTTMTRAMFVTVLGRLANVNADMYNTVSFDDVEAGSWYAPYVQWACDAGIVNGYGDGKFGVNDPVTVEQAAVLLARFAAYTGIQTANDMDLSRFTDIAMVSNWAVAPMQFVVGNGIYTGTANALEPQSPAKRSLLAEMLYAYVMHFGE